MLGVTLVAVAPQATAQGSPLRLANANVPVTACPAQAALLTPLAPIPTIATVPSSVSVAPGMTLYGTGLYGTTTALAIGPATFGCSSVESADGGEGITLTDPSNPQHSIVFSYFAGGTGPSFAAACPYIPAIASEPIGQQVGFTCTPPPSSEAIAQVPTGIANVYSAIVQAPPAGGATDESVSLVIASPGDSTTDPTSQSATCTLPTSQAAVCLTALEFFATQSYLVNTSPTALQSLFAALRSALGVAPPSTSTTTPADQAECHANGDVSLEDEINKSANAKIPIPDNGIALPAGLPGRVTVSFVPGDLQVCKNNLSPILNTPGGFVSGELSLSAADSAGGVAEHGPFEYSAAATAWTNVPGAPPGQELTTMFSPAKFDASVDPQLSASFSSSGPSVDVQIATATVSALAQSVTLVGGGVGPLLQVTLGPSLELAVTIDKGAADDAVTNEEAGDVDPATAEADAADELAGDTVVGIDLELSEYYGVIIATSDEQTIFIAVRGSLVTSFADDPVISEFSPPDADAIPTEVSPADAASLDGELAASDAIEVSGLGELAFFFVL